MESRNSTSAATHAQAAHKLQDKGPRRQSFQVEDIGCTINKQAQRLRLVQHPEAASMAKKGIDGARTPPLVGEQLEGNPIDLPPVKFARNTSVTGKSSSFRPEILQNDATSSHCDFVKMEDSAVKSSSFRAPRHNETSGTMVSKMSRTSVGTNVSARASQSSVVSTDDSHSQRGSKIDKKDWLHQNAMSEVDAEVSKIIKRVSGDSTHHHRHSHRSSASVHPCMPSTAITRDSANSNMNQMFSKGADPQGRRSLSPKPPSATEKSGSRSPSPRLGNIGGGGVHNGDPGQDSDSDGFGEAFADKRGSIDADIPRNLRDDDDNFSEGSNDTLKHFQGMQKAKQRHEDVQAGRADKSAALAKMGVTVAKSTEDVDQKKTFSIAPFGNSRKTKVEQDSEEAAQDFHKWLQEGAQVDFSVIERNTGGAQGNTGGASRARRGGNLKYAFIF